MERTRVKEENDELPPPPGFEYRAPRKNVVSGGDGTKNAVGTESVPPPPGFESRAPRKNVVSGGVVAAGGDGTKSEIGTESVPPPPGYEARASLKKVVSRGDGTKNAVGTESLPPPPGFESRATSKSKKVVSSRRVGVSGDRTKNAIGTESYAARATRRRPRINYREYSDDDEDDDYEDDDDDDDDGANSDNATSVQPLDQVTARWHPDEAITHVLEDAPVFYPSEEEFEDTLGYIAKIRPRAERYGICRIVPPASWRPPCPLKGKQVWEHSEFKTRVQRVHMLQNRSSNLGKQVRKKNRKRAKTGMDFVSNGGERNELEAFGFELGPGFTLEEFKKYADEFKARYFKKSEVGDSMGGWEPGVEDVEGEYWRIVEKETEGVKVLHGADIETGVFGSGFPKKVSSNYNNASERYERSGWNLNNFARLPGSLLTYEGDDISGVLMPWLYIGMCFSSFCWHVEDHHLYSMNYLHWGEPKVWYAVGGKDADKLEVAMKNHLPHLFEEQPDLLHKLVTLLSPSILKASGVAVQRCVQRAGEFVVTFPGAYHAGFDIGFNCAEAVNVAPLDWLPHGQAAVELYRRHGRKTTISHDKLLLGAARQVVEPGQCEQITIENLRLLAKTLKERVDVERARRGVLCNTALALKMHSNFDASSERECCVCFFDLHLSAAGCRCSPERYSCLTHVKEMCSCPLVAKYFLFRYEIDELDAMVEAVEGKLSSVDRYAGQDLGFDSSGLVEVYVGVEIPKDLATHQDSGSIHVNEIIVLSSDDDEDDEDDAPEERDAVSPGEGPTALELEASGNISAEVTANNADEVCQDVTNSNNQSGGLATLLDAESNSPERLIGQEGPYNVEPLSFGCVVSAKSWCNQRAIFTKGFRSRVKYIDILDPTNHCYYISEIFDADRDYPMFMVYLEDNLSEVFVHLSPIKCWEMVRDRVNQEILKQSKAGRSDLPPLQPSGSPDGFEMFGYSSPEIVQAIEELDANRVSTEYWVSRPFLPAAVEVMLKNANMEALSSLEQVLSESNIDLVTEFLKKEIKNRRS